MMRTTLSGGGRFVVLDDLHLDRDVFEALARWAADRGLAIQDAIQLALCALSDGALDRPSGLIAPASAPRTRARSPWLGPHE